MSVHVSPRGHDSADGTADRPLATLHAARDLLRSTDSIDDKRIVVHGGEYFEASIELNREDSGITIEAAEGEKPVLYGGKLVTGWRDDGDELVSAPLDGVREGQWDFRALVVNGRFAPRARLPKEGVLLHESEFNANWMSSTAGGWDRKPTEEELTTMQYKEGDLGEWLNVRNAEVRVYHQWDESLVGVKSLDAAARRLTFSTPCGHPPGAFGRHSSSNKSSWYVVFNVREGMHAPGMWYLDRTRGMVVYRPRPGEQLDDLRVVAPNSYGVIRLAGTDGAPVENVTIRGIEIQATTTKLKAGGFGGALLDAAISLDGSRDVLIEDVTLRNVGGKAIATSGKSCERIRVQGCRLDACGGPGIMIRGNECSVTDCTVREIGLTYPSSIALSVSGSRCVIAHNEVAGCPYTALHGGGEDTVYENNYTTDFMRELDDGAAIYIFAGKRVIYRGNVAIGGGGLRGALSHAYYLDERSENCIVEHNLAIDTGWPSHNHMSRNCSVRNNVFLDCGPSRITMMKCAGFTFERNIVVADGEIRISAPEGGITSLPNNVIFSRSGEVVREQLDSGGYAPESEKPLVENERDGTVLADPRLLIDENRRCSFGEGSPAEKLGISPLDFSSAGPRDSSDDARAEGALNEIVSRRRGAFEKLAE